jgi:hypothetical protein
LYTIATPAEITTVKISRTIQNPPLLDNVLCAFSAELACQPEDEETVADTACRKSDVAIRTPQTSTCKTSGKIVHHAQQTKTGTIQLANRLRTFLATRLLLNLICPSLTLQPVLTLQLYRATLLRSARI